MLDTGILNALTVSVYDGINAQVDVDDLMQMLESNEPLWDQQKSADVDEIRVTFALAEFLKYQSSNEEETVSMLDMAQNIFESYKQSKAKVLRRVLSRFMRSEQQKLILLVRTKFDLWQARSAQPKQALKQSVHSL